MKIYFAASITGGRSDQHMYDDLIEYLKSKGTVLTEHIGNPNLTANGESLPLSEIHDRDMAWLFDSDVIVAEVTTSSLGVGYELGRAFEAGKKVLCLIRKKEGIRVSAMIGGNPLLNVQEYETLNDAYELIDAFFHE